MAYDPNEARDSSGRWSDGGGGSTKAAPRKGLAAKFRSATEWVKSGDAQRVLTAAITNPENHKAAVALGIKSALYHLGNMDDPAMEVIDPFVHTQVHNISQNLHVVEGRAREMMATGVAKLIAARRAAMGSIRG